MVYVLIVMFVIIWLSSISFEDGAKHSCERHDSFHSISQRVSRENKI